MRGLLSVGLTIPLLLACTARQQAMTESDQANPQQAASQSSIAEQTDALSDLTTPKLREQALSGNATAAFRYAERVNDVAEKYKFYWLANELAPSSVRQARAANAAFQLGGMASVDERYATAARWLERAAKLGSAEGKYWAQHEYRIRPENSSLDESTALAYLQNAAVQGRIPPAEIDYAYARAAGIWGAAHDAENGLSVLFDISNSSEYHKFWRGYAAKKIEQIGEEHIAGGWRAVGENSSVVMFISEKTVAPEDGIKGSWAMFLKDPNANHGDIGSRVLFYANCKRGLMATRSRSELDSTFNPATHRRFPNPVYEPPAPGTLGEAALNEICKDDG